MPMPTSQLMHPLFESAQRDRRLRLQNFHPVSRSACLISFSFMILRRQQEILTDVATSQVLAFPSDEKNPFRVFGLPRNLLVEVGTVCMPFWTPSHY